MIDETLGGYLVLERLGRGGMGSVYRAEDERGAPCALKMLDLALAEDPTASRRFEREIELLSELEHPRIVRALSGLRREGERLFYAMELVDGEDLGRRLRSSGAVPLDEALALVDDVLAGLEAAHEAGVLHRDVKPANIFVGADGRAKLGDFGLAHVAGLTRLTRAASVIGTPEYMAPEQAEGEAPSEATDVYAVGVVLFELLSGELPFRADAPLAVLRMQVERDPPELPRSVPKAVRAIVTRALRKQPSDRFARAATMRAAVREARAAIARGDADDRAGAELAGAETKVAGRRSATRRRARAAEPEGLAPAPVAPRPRPRPAAVAPRGVGLGPVIALVILASLVVAAIGLGVTAWRGLMRRIEQERARGDGSGDGAGDRPGDRSGGGADDPAGGAGGEGDEGPPSDTVPPPVDWIRVELHNGEVFEGELVRLDLAADRLVTRSRSGELRRVALAEVRTYGKRPPPPLPGD